jgi:hypothetical protein
LFVFAIFFRELSIAAAVYILLSAAMVVVVFKNDVSHRPEVTSVT